MGYLDPELMGVFCSKIANPWNLHRVYGICSSYCWEDLKHPAGAYGMVDNLSDCLGVPISEQQRDDAAHWLMCCDVDPQNRDHQRSMWGLIHGNIF